MHTHFHTGDERRYSLWPVTYGTQEHTFLTWKKGGGIVKYTSYAGNCRDMVFFWASGYEKHASMEEKQNIELWMEHWKGEYRFHECLGTAWETSAKFWNYHIRIYREGDQYYADDHALLLLRQMEDEVYTYWEDVTPMLEENEK